MTLIETIEAQPLELAKLQHSYAWNLFDFHAKQRVSMFNYFLIIAGIFASGIIASWKTDIHWMPIALGLLGAFTAFGFILLDCRNKQLVELAEDVLLKIETDWLYTIDFKVSRKEKPKDQNPIQGGFMLREYLEEQKRKKTEFIKNLKEDTIKHKVVIRSIESLVLVCFLASSFLALIKQPAILNVPALVAPINSLADQQTTIILQWQDTNGIPQEIGYIFRLKTEGGNYSYFSTAADSTSYLISNLAKDKNYYWSIQAKGNGSLTKDSFWPPDWRFTTAK